MARNEGILVDMVLIDEAISIRSIGGKMEFGMGLHQEFREKLDQILLFML